MAHSSTAGLVAHGETNENKEIHESALARVGSVVDTDITSFTVNDATIDAKRINLKKPRLQVNKHVLSSVANDDVAETVSNRKINGVDLTNDKATSVDYGRR